MVVAVAAVVDMAVAVAAAADMVAAEAAAVTVVVVAAVEDIVKIINPTSIECEKVEPGNGSTFLSFYW